MCKVTKKHYQLYFLNKEDLKRLFSNCGMRSKSSRQEIH